VPSFRRVEEVFANECPAALGVFLLRDEDRVGDLVLRSHVAAGVFLVLAVDDFHHSAVIAPV